jgi:murein DD-endopeptidase
MSWNTLKPGRPEAFEAHQPGSWQPKPWSWVRRSGEGRGPRSTIRSGPEVTAGSSTRWTGEPAFLADVVANWLGEGAEVLAVTDGVVAAVRDDVAESERISTHPRLPQEDATGNYIALEVGDGRFVFYEHLQPGTLRVRPGQRVRRGDVIATVGFTGHSTGPHLHLHVADANSPLGAEGVPFVLERFELLGGYDDSARLGTAPWIPLSAGPAMRSGERPAPNVVIRF